MLPIPYGFKRTALLLAGLTLATVPPAAGEEAAPPAGTEAHSHAGAYLAGRFAEQNSDYRTAADLLDRLLEDKPGDFAMERRAFLSHLRAGNDARAEELAKTITETHLQPTSTALVAVTAVDVREGDWAAALRNAERIPQQGLAKYAAPMILAWAHAGAGNAVQAVEALASLSDSGGFQHLRSLHEGLIQAHVGDYDAALAALVHPDADVLNAPIRLVRTVAKIHRLKGDDAAAREILTGYLEKVPGARSVEDDLADLSAGKKPTPLSTPAEGLADGFYQLASGVRQQSDEVALIYGRLASLLAPALDLPPLLVGTILEDRERHAEAIETLRQIGPDSGLYWDARLSIADNLIHLERDQEAIDLLETMAAERPDNTSPLVKIGYMMRADENYLEEVDIYNRAIARIQDEPERRHWLLFYNRGIAYERSKQWPSAEADFLKALDLKPDDPFVLNYLGYSWVEMGMNIGLAKEMIRKAVDQRQSDGYIVDSLGWVLFRIGQYEEAVGHLERAVQLRPQDPVINDHLGDAYWQVGRRNEARFQWDRALNLEPDEELVPAIKDKLTNGMSKPEVIEISN